MYKIFVEIELMFIFKAQHVASNFGLKCCKKDSKEEDSKLNLVEGTVSFKINGVDQKSIFTYLSFLGILT